MSENTENGSAGLQVKKLLRFNYRSIPGDIKDYDYDAGDPTWTLVYRVVNWWTEENDVTEELFPYGRPTKGTGQELLPRGERVVVADTDWTPFSHESLLLPPQYSYCAYEVRQDTSPHTPVIDRPPIPKQSRGVAEAAQTALNEAVLLEAVDEPLSHEEAEQRPLIYLFNLIVALEWEPNDEDRRELAWAFRRASDFLYDISDGRLAFGQALIGTSEAHMKAADILISASSRMQGRSWVAGIHEISKRMPIRLGRGDWRRTYCIPWDEPEGYRVIAHEWAHYALHLRDRYLVRRGVQIVGDELVQAASATGGEYILATKPYFVGSSVMEMLDGVSELAIRVSDDEDDLGEHTMLPSEIELLRKLYPSKTIEGSGRPSGGPGQLRLPLPLIHFQPVQPQQQTHRLLFDARPHFANLGLCPPDKAQSQSSEVPYDQCWLYVVSPEDAADANRKLIAQGTLDIRAGLQPFTLLGASNGDRLIAVVYPRSQKPNIFVGAIRQELEGSAVMARIDGWRTVTLPQALPIITVLPKPRPEILPLFDEITRQAPEIAVRVALIGNGWAEPTRIWLCPLGGAVSTVTLDEHGVSEEIDIDGLDGHVVLWYNNGNDPFICTFSHGGNPPSHTGGSLRTLSAKVVPPITAGSSDGNVRIYFDKVGDGGDTSESVTSFALNEADREFLRHYSHVRFVTTTHNGAAGEAPRLNAQPIGYPFSIASNSYLIRTEVHTTLELRYATYERLKWRDGALRICRLVDGHWQIEPTYTFETFQALARYLPANSPFYNQDELADRERVEHYQLWWIPSIEA
jgi:hypothetical protein